MYDMYRYTAICHLPEQNSIIYKENSLNKLSKKLNISYQTAKKIYSNDQKSQLSKWITITRDEKRDYKRYVRIADRKNL